MEFKTGITKKGKLKMKKLIAVILSFVLCLSFAACSKEVVSSNDYKQKMETITESLNKGKIPEIEYALGDNPDGIKKHFEDLLANESHDGDEGHNHSHDEVTSFTVTQGLRSVKMDAGKFVYHYEIDKKEKGVSVIVSYTEAFGFTAGEATMQDVAACFDPNSVKTVLPSDDDMYFLVYPSSDCMVLRYEKDNLKLDFYFSENVLIATVLLDKSNWTL